MSPFYSGENEGSERPFDMPRLTKITQLSCRVEDEPSPPDPQVYTFVKGAVAGYG